PTSGITIGFGRDPLPVGGSTITYGPRFGASGFGAIAGVWLLPVTVGDRVAGGCGCESGLPAGGCTTPPWGSVDDAGCGGAAGAGAGVGPGIAGSFTGTSAGIGSIRGPPSVVGSG